MKPVGVAVAFAGYTLAYFGWYSLQGPGVGMLDLLIPGRFVNLADTSSSGSSTTTGPGGAAPKPTGPGGPTGARSGALPPAGPRG